MRKPMGEDRKKRERKEKEELVVKVTRDPGAPTHATAQECHCRDNPKS
jgi:hypothetical protein